MENQTPIVVPEIPAKNPPKAAVKAHHRTTARKTRTPASRNERASQIHGEAPPARQAISGRYSCVGADFSPPSLFSADSVVSVLNLSFRIHLFKVPQSKSADHADCSPS